MNWSVSVGSAAYIAVATGEDNINTSYTDFFDNDKGEISYEFGVPPEAPIALKGNNNPANYFNSIKASTGLSIHTAEYEANGRLPHADMGDGIYIIPSGGAINNRKANAAGVTFTGKTRFRNINGCLIFSHNYVDGAQHRGVYKDIQLTGVEQNVPPTTSTIRIGKFKFYNMYNPANITAAKVTTDNTQTLDYVQDPGLFVVIPTESLTTGITGYFYFDPTWCTKKRDIYTTMYNISSATTHAKPVTDPWLLYQFIVGGIEVSSYSLFKSVDHTRNLNTTKQVLSALTSAVSKNVNELVSTINNKHKLLMDNYNKQLSVINNLKKILN